MKPVALKWQLLNLSHAALSLFSHAIGQTYSLPMSTLPDKRNYAMIAGRCRRPQTLILSEEPLFTHIPTPCTGMIGRQLLHEDNCWATVCLLTHKKFIGSQLLHGTSEKNVPLINSHTYTLASLHSQPLTKSIIREATTSQPRKLL